MKRPGTYLVVTCLLVIYLTKGVMTVLPFTSKALTSIAWVLPEDCEKEDCKSGVSSFEPDFKNLYFNDGVIGINLHSPKDPAQRKLRDNILHYKAVHFSPTTPPPEAV